MHIALTDSGFQRDNSFDCNPGSYGAYTVGPLVDIRALLDVNTFNATVMGVDAAGTLLYCAPGQVAQAIPLPPPDTNWGRVKAFTMNSGNLYVEDRSPNWPTPSILQSTTTTFTSFTPMDIYPHVPTVTSKPFPRDVLTLCHS